MTMLGLDVLQVREAGTDNSTFKLLIYIYLFIEVVNN